MTRREASILKNPEDEGFLIVQVSKETGGLVDVATFTVDVWCLGVRDALLHLDLSPGEAEELKRLQTEVLEEEKIHPACAKKLIEGAVAYAKQLGFSPPKKFRKASKLLNSLNSSACPTEFTYGREGRPCYIPLSEDDDRRIDRVLDILERTCGPGGFDFEEEEEGIDVREAFQIYCETLPNDVGGFYFISGFVTAALVAPEVVKLSDVVQALSGILGLEPEDLPEFTGHLFPYWNGVAEMVMECLEPRTREDARCVDIWVDDLPPDNEVAIMIVSILWARGWKAALEQWPENFGDFPTQPGLTAAWESIELWATHEKDNDTLNRYMDEVDAGVRPNLGDAVKQLAIAMRGTS